MPSTGIVPQSNIPGKIAIIDPKCAELLLKTLEGANIFKHAEAFCRVCVLFVTVFVHSTFVLVSRYVLGGELQPPAALLLPQTDPLLNEGL